MHPNIPIIHKLRYFDVLDQTPSESQRCLQLAVQATAAASTTQTLKLSDSLYAEACAVLDNVEIHGPIGRARAPVELDYIQAILLIVYYEALRMPQNRYLLTAGRAFRLVQIARLHEVDMESLHDCSSEAFARAEEQRRTFWAAYCFDRLLSIRHDLPLTFHDVAVSLFGVDACLNLAESYSITSPRGQLSGLQPGLYAVPERCHVESECGCAACIC